MSWDRTDPLLQHISLDDLVFVPSEPIDTTSELKVIADGQDGAVIAVAEEGLVKHVIVRFQLSQSTWPIQPGGIVFMQNALDLQVGGGAGAQGRVYRPGQVAQIYWPHSAASLGVAGDTVMELPTPHNAAATTQMPRKSGLYEVMDVDGNTLLGQPADVFVAVNLDSAIESDLRTVPNVDVGGRLVASGGPVEGLHALWPWLIALALLLLSIEWLIYTAQRRGA